MRAIKRIGEIRGKRERAFVVGRIKGKMEKEKAEAVQQIEKSKDILQIPEMRKKISQKMSSGAELKKMQVDA